MEGSNGGQQHPQPHGGDDDVFAEINVEEITGVVNTLHEFYMDEGEHGARALFKTFFDPLDHVFPEEFDEPGQEQSM